LQKSFQEIPLYLAPMAGITDMPFRIICKQMGADVLMTEMISTRGLVYNDNKTAKLLQVSPDENPIGVQLFGNAPKDFEESVKKIDDLPFDFININMGCPTPKIVKNGDGCALMKDVKLASSIIKVTLPSFSLIISMAFFMSPSVPTRSIMNSSPRIFVSTL
jgi:tRNA-dihydrouridine synthase B